MTSWMLACTDRLGVVVEGLGAAVLYEVHRASSREKNERTAAANSFGASMAAKWPPLGGLDQCVLTIQKYVTVNVNAVGERLAGSGRRAKRHRGRA